MSSIAYITDPNMIDFHRLRGNQTMVFWRFSLRKFTRFNPGDLVFFIDKRARHPHTHEKGLVGYGRCTEIRNKSPKATWDQHKQATGYAQYEDFTEAIKFYRKNDHRLPQQLQVIKLDSVYFFQSPIFLGEIDINLNQRLESFTYIEKDGKDASQKLLEIGLEVGLDQWMSSQNSEVSVEDIKYDLQEQEIRSVLELIDTEYTKQQTSLIKNHTNCVVNNNIYYTFNKGVLEIVYPLTHKNQINEMIGLKTIIDIVLEIPFNFKVVSNFILESKVKNLLQALNLELVQI